MALYGRRLLACVRVAVRGAPNKDSSRKESVGTNNRKQRDIHAEPTSGIRRRPLAPAKVVMTSLDQTDARSSWDRRRIARESRRETREEKEILRKMEEDDGSIAAQCMQVCVSGLWWLMRLGESGTNSIRPADAQCPASLVGLRSPTATSDP